MKYSPRTGFQRNPGPRSQLGEMNSGRGLNLGQAKTAVRKGQEEVETRGW